MDPPSPHTPSSAQHRIISHKWPRVTRALEETYCEGLDWTRTTNKRTNLCGYMLWALNNYTAICHEIWPDNPPHHGALDYAAAREIRYHWTKRTNFRSPIHALAKCLANLPSERPERIAHARRAVPETPETEKITYANTSSPSSGTTPSWSVDQTRKHSNPVRIGTLLPSLTQNNTKEAKPITTRNPVHQVLERNAT